MDSPNLVLAEALAEFLQKHGVRKVVLCPGSRNAPLMFTLQNHFEVFHHHDERAATFFALGLIQSSQAPVAVVTTSGTAVAEMLPATVEAYYQKLPLILVSADRPEEYRHTGAPQAIEQVGIFSHYAKTHDNNFPQEFSYPVHINLRLTEPKPGDWKKVSSKVPSTIEQIPATFEPKVPGVCSKVLDVFRILSSTQSSRFGAFEPGLVVVGSLSPAEARWVGPLLAKLKVPVLADATSNLNFAGEHLPYLLKCGEKLLRRWQPDRVLRLGSVPSFRFWRDLEFNSIPLLNIDVAPDERSFSGLSRPSQSFVVPTFEVFEDLALPDCENNEVMNADRVLSLELEKLLKQYPRSELAFVRKLRDQEGMLYLGNSLPIREWSLVNGAHAQAFANRGANGIDGQVSTYLGLADSYPESWALVGDQTALYDLNALAISNQASPGKKFTSRRRIVIMNNRGGKIFSHLSYSHEIEHHQRQVLENHHRWEFRAWAEMFGWGYEAWQGESTSLDHAMHDVVIEIFPDASETQNFWNAWRKV